MNYPTAPYGVYAVPKKSNTTKIVIIVVVSVVVAIGILAAIGIGLGVGLGVGLSKNSDSSSSSSDGSSSSSSTYSILSAPTVSCTYGGSATCGCSATQPSFLSPRIIQGYTAVANSWPWIVALYINNAKTFCGGFLISYQHIITAAHCVNGITASTITAYAGIQQLSQRSSGQSRVAANVTVHPSYSTTGYVYDIAIITLQTAFTQTTAVGKCCLTYDTSLPSVGEHAVISGWGVTSSSGTTPSDELLQGVIQIQSSSSACTTYASSVQFCAGYSGTDSCYGDSGSPLMTSVNNSWTCTGIVSSGRGCGTTSLYTKVSAFETFITNAISG